MKHRDTICRINETVAIPWRELKFTFSRAGGPGGQHVNKVSTRVSLLFDVNASPSLTDRQKSLINKRLAARINRDGQLRVDCAATRGQAANRVRAVEIFAGLLARALRSRKRRRPTRPGAAAREKRLQAKKRRSGIKKQRARPILD